MIQNIQPTFENVEYIKRIVPSTDNTTAVLTIKGDTTQLYKVYDNNQTTTLITGTFDAGENETNYTINLNGGLVNVQITDNNYHVFKIIRQNILSNS
jgi:rRNA pseudouridine-1189 N-methylase Emg1 (Nep1/Mra1 family)